MFLGAVGGIAEVRGSEGLGCKSCRSRNVCWVAGAGGEDSRLETAREISPSAARDSALWIALSSWTSGLSM